MLCAVSVAAAAPACSARGCRLRARDGAPRGRRCGIACIVPPKGWAPPFALERGTNGQSAESFRFLIRKQLTSHLCMRRGNSDHARKAASRCGPCAPRPRAAPRGAARPARPAPPWTAGGPRGAAGAAAAAARPNPAPPKLGPRARLRAQPRARPGQAMPCPPLLPSAPAAERFPSLLPYPTCTPPRAGTRGRTRRRWTARRPRRRAAARATRPRRASLALSRWTARTRSSRSPATPTGPRRCTSATRCRRRARRRLAAFCGGAARAQCRAAPLARRQCAYYMQRVGSACVAVSASGERAAVSSMGQQLLGVCPAAAVAATSVRRRAHASVQGCLSLPGKAVLVGAAQQSLFRQRAGAALRAEGPAGARAQAAQAVRVQRPGPERGGDRGRVLAHRGDARPGAAPSPAPPAPRAVA